MNIYNVYKYIYNILIYNIYITYYIILYHYIIHGLQK